MKSFVKVLPALLILQFFLIFAEFVLKGVK